MGVQRTNAFPANPWMQAQDGMWLITVHSAFWPQVPGHGSIHLFLIQALSLEQSLFRTHSGLHSLYGSPWYSARQVHIPSLHWAFAPQGFGLQGFLGSSGSEMNSCKLLFFLRLFKILLGGGSGKQLVNGSPVYPSKQVHIGVWLITLQTADAPQDPGHGSIHFCLIQAKLLGHSELIEHSGRQFGGFPKYSGKQEQEGVPPTSRHWEFGPHGEGTQGFTICGSTGFGGGAKIRFFII